MPVCHTQHTLKHDVHSHAEPYPSSLHPWCPTSLDPPTSCRARCACCTCSTCRACCACCATRRNGCYLNSRPSGTTSSARLIQKAYCHLHSQQAQEKDVATKVLPVSAVLPLFLFLLLVVLLVVVVLPLLVLVLLVLPKPCI